jgi:outer membrane protein OmpA-like peptidoglycan-associated protein
MKRILAVTLMLLVVTALSAQDQERGRQEVRKYPKAKTGKKKKLAKSLAKQGSYYSSVEYYQDILKDKPGDIKAMHAIAEMNRDLRDYKAAEKYYKLELDKDAGKWPNDRYWVGVMEMMNGKYEDARKSFSEYNKSTLDKGEMSYKSIAKMHMEGCDSAAIWMAVPSKMKVLHEEGSINNILTDMAPKPLPDGRLLYSSLKSDTAIFITDNSKDYYSKIFIAKRDGKGWVDDEKLSYPPNDSKNHVGNANMTDDGKTLFYTKCDQSEIRVMRCKIYKTDKQGAEWGNPIEVKELNSATATTTQPAFGLDKDGNKIIYFVSDRGGKGGMDIFYAPMNADGTFGAVKNAGPEVNSAGDERTPFYNEKEKTLYFSSDARPGLGGFDVFKIAGQPDAWTSIATNIGPPVNSSYDDLYYILDKTGRKGFVVSNRIGTKTTRGETSGDDIWGVSIREDVVLIAYYASRNDPTSKPIEGVDASLYMVKDKNYDFIGNTITASTPFSYILKRGQSYKINGNKDTYWPSVENVIVKEDEERDTIKVVFLIDPIIKKKVKIENIYFEFDKSRLVDFYRTKMDSVINVLNNNPGYALEVQGHTDSKGADDYNVRLSQRRAEEAKAYILSKGIAKVRVISKGMGETTPLAANEKDGADDPEGRARNRRVEFKLIPDKPESAPEIEYAPGEPINETKTGPGFNKK